MCESSQAAGAASGLKNSDASMYPVFNTCITGLYAIMDNSDREIKKNRNSIFCQLLQFEARPIASMSIQFPEINDVSIIAVPVNYFYCLTLFGASCLLHTTYPSYR